MFRAIFRNRWVNYVKILDRINQDGGFIGVDLFIFDRPCYQVTFGIEKQAFSDLMFPSRAWTGDTSGLKRPPDYHDLPMLLRDLISFEDR